MYKIGILTQSNQFDTHLTQFKRRNTSAQKLNVESSLKGIDCLIVDLSYPLEQAYLYLQEIRKNYQYSEVCILVAISHRSQVKKLRTFAFGVNGYISPNIEFEELWLKIRQLSDPGQHLLKKKFDKIPAKIQVDGSLTHISEEGAIVKSRVSARPGQRIKVSAQLFEDLGLQKKIFFRVSKTNPTMRKSFISEVDFLALSDQDRDTIRKMVLDWGAR